MDVSSGGRYPFFILLVDSYQILILVRVIMSWFPVNPNSAVARFVYDLTEPMLGWLRDIIPPIGMFDVSPIAAFFLLDLLKALYAMMFGMHTMTMMR